MIYNGTEWINGTLCHVMKKNGTADRCLFCDYFPQSVSQLNKTDAENE